MKIGTGAREAAPPAARALVRALALFLGLSSAVAGCAPTLTFSAQPRLLCQGAAATKLTWNTNGQATLTSVPPTDGAGALPGQGERTVSVGSTTTFAVTANKSGKSVTGTQLVTVVNASQDQPVQLDPKSCAGGAAIFETTLPAATWADGIQVDAVKLSAPLTVDLVIEHGGKSVTLAQGETTKPGLEGANMSGLWHATLKLAACADAPDALVLHTTIKCAP